MKLCRILPVILLFGSRQGAAQTSAAASEWPQRRWAVGTQVAFYPRMAIVEATAGQGVIDYVRPWPVMPTVAYQTRKSGSFEIGLLLHVTPLHTTTETNSSLTLVRHRQGFTRAVPVIYRGPLRLPNQGRLRVDLEVGFMPVSSFYREEQSITDARTGQTYSPGNHQYDYNDFLLISGIGAAYALRPNLSLTADARVTFSVLGAVVAEYFGGNAISAFAPALSAGVRYQFGKTLP